MDFGRRTVLRHIYPETLRMFTIPISHREVGKLLAKSWAFSASSILHYLRRTTLTFMLSFAIQIGWGKEKDAGSTVLQLSECWDGQKSKIRSCRVRFGTRVRPPVETKAQGTCSKLICIGQKCLQISPFWHWQNGSALSETEEPLSLLQSENAKSEWSIGLLAGSSWVWPNNRVSLPNPNGLFTFSPFKWPFHQVVYPIFIKPMHQLLLRVPVSAVSENLAGTILRSEGWMSCLHPPAISHHTKRVARGHSGYLPTPEHSGSSVGLLAKLQPNHLHLPTPMPSRSQSRLNSSQI